MPHRQSGNFGRCIWWIHTLVTLKDSPKMALESSFRSPMVWVGEDSKWLPSQVVPAKQILKHPVGRL